MSLINELRDGIKKQGYRKIDISKTSFIGHECVIKILVLCFVHWYLLKLIEFKKALKL